ncbi:MAG: hypothetical protein JO057_24045 [Chloroflexi bacterium]|nr:hypothetical protein [Chloroflexota bacterium]
MADRRRRGPKVPKVSVCVLIRHSQGVSAPNGRGGLLEKARDDRVELPATATTWTHEVEQPRPLHNVLEARPQGQVEDIAQHLG